MVRSSWRHVSLGGAAGGPSIRRDGLESRVQNSISSRMVVRVPLSLIAIERREGTVFW